MRKIVLNGVRLAIMSCGLIAAAVQSHAKEPDMKDWIGKRVVPKAQDFTLDVGDDKAKSRVELDIWCVEKEDGPRLWVRGERLGLAGWARTDQVISVEKAIDYFTSEIREHPRVEFAFIVRARLGDDKKEYQKAIADLNEAIRLDPQNAQTYTACALALYAKKENEENIRKFTESVRTNLRTSPGSIIRSSMEPDALDPQMIAPLGPTGGGTGFPMRTQPTVALAHRDRGSEWFDKMEYDKAITEFNEAIRLDPGDPRLYNYRGVAWMCKHEYYKAIDDFSECIRREPQSPFNFTNRGFAWKEKNEYEKAIVDFTECIRLEPLDGVSFLNRGHVWQAMKEFDKAISDFSESIRLDPKNAVVYQSRGDAWLSKNEFDKAIADFTETIRLMPNRTSAVSSRTAISVSHLDQNERDGTKPVESATKSSEQTTWEVARYLESLAAGYAEVGDFASAVHWQTNALTLATDPAQQEELHLRLKLFQEKKSDRDTSP